MGAFRELAFVVGLASACTVEMQGITRLVSRPKPKYARLQLTSISLQPICMINPELEAFKR